MKHNRLSSLVTMLLLGLLVGPSLADIRIPPPGPDVPKGQLTTTPEKSEIKPPAPPEKSEIKPPTPPAKPEGEIKPPPLPDSQISTTSVVMAGSFLALAIVCFGLVLFRIRKPLPKSSE